MKLTQEGYSPRVLRLGVEQAGKTSFAQASADLRELADIRISPTHLQRLCERIGGEWTHARDADVEAFRNDRLAALPAEPPGAAAVMLDGGRVQTRAEEAGRGVHEPAWSETKVACCLSLSSRESAVDPQPEPPRKLLEPTEVARLAAQMGAAGPTGRPSPRRATGAGNRKSRSKRRPARKRRRPVKLVRTVVASMASSEEFGWQVAAEVHRRRLSEAPRKACICDGQHWNWTIFALHLLPWGFIGILDIIHLVTRLYGAAQAAASQPEQAWRLYQQWLSWSWSGQVGELLRGLKQQAERLGEAPAGAREDDPRRVLAEAIGYVRNNRDKMDYPQYRRLGLPISSAPVESVIKQVNQRVKGSEKFWLRGGLEAVLQVRAARLSEDGRSDLYWKRPRPRGRAAGSSRLGRR